MRTGLSGSAQGRREIGGVSEARTSHQVMAAATRQNPALARAFFAGITPPGRIGGPEEMVSGAATLAAAPHALGAAGTAGHAGD